MIFKMANVRECWIIDYARTPFSRSRPKQPEKDVFGEKRIDELLATLLMKFFDEKLAKKGIKKEDVDEFTIGCAMGVYENWTYGGRLPLFLANFPATVPALLTSALLALPPLVPAPVLDPALAVMPSLQQSCNAHVCMVMSTMLGQPANTYTICRVKGQ